MSDEPTAAELAKLEKLYAASDKLTKLTQEASDLYDAGKLTAEKIEELQSKGDAIAEKIGPENVPDWDESLARYRDEIALAPKRLALY